MPKLSIYLSDDVFVALGEPENVSGRIAGIIQRYDQMVEAAQPQLTIGEWFTVFACLKDFDGSASTLRLLWASVAEGGDLNLGAAYPVDKRALSRKLRRLPFASLAALAEYSARYWATDDIMAPGVLKELHINPVAEAA